MSVQRPIGDASRKALLDRVLTNIPQHMPWLDRTACIEALKQNGLPMPGKGSWQHSDLVALCEDTLSLSGESSSVESSTEVEISPFTQDRSTIPLMPLTSSSDIGSFPLLDFNGLLCRSGTSIRTKQHSTDASALLRDATGTIDRHLVFLGEDHHLHLQERFETGNRVVLVRVQDKARLEYDLTLPPHSGIGYHCIVIWLGNESTLNLRLSARGSKLRRNDIVVNLIGRDASAKLSGGWFLHGREHLDTQLTINHRIGGSKSNQLIHGVVDDHGRATFSGFIRIDREAMASEAHLTNRNIALSPNARVNAHPELEIYADDVVCSHGATTGQLDEDALFLLRARGIDESAARTMMIHGFLKQVIESEQGAELLNL